MRKLIRLFILVAILDMLFLWVISILSACDIITLESYKISCNVWWVTLMSDILLTYIIVFLFKKRLDDYDKKELE